MAETATQEESPSAGDTLAGAAKDLPLALPVSKAVKSAGEGDYGSVASDVANFAMGAQSILEDPLNALISAGLGFLLDVIQPLKDALELVTGNPEALDEGGERLLRDRQGHRQPRQRADRDHRVGFRELER